MPENTPRPSESSSTKNTSRPSGKRNQEKRQPLSPAEVQSRIATIVASLQTNPSRLTPVFNLATGRAGARQIFVQTGECQSLSRALQDLDRVMLFSSGRTLFADPEVTAATSHARSLVSDAAHKLVEAISAMAQASGFDVATLYSSEIRALLIAEEKAAKKARGEEAAGEEPEVSPVLASAPKTI